MLTEVDISASQMIPHRTWASFFGWWMQRDSWTSLTHEVFLAPKYKKFGNYLFENTLNVPFWISDLAPPLINTVVHRKKLAKETTRLCWLLCFASYIMLTFTVCKMDVDFEFVHHISRTRLFLPEGFTLGCLGSSNIVSLFPFVKV